MKRALLGTVTLLVLLGGCAGEESEPKSSKAQPTAEKTEGRVPKCDDVWIQGSVVPDDYSGCNDGSDVTMGSPAKCKAGPDLATYDVLWGYIGGEVKKFRAGYEDDPNGDPAFKAAFAKCIGA